MCSTDPAVHVDLWSDSELYSLGIRTGNPTSSGPGQGHGRRCIEQLGKLIRFLYLQLVLWLTGTDLELLRCYDHSDDHHKPPMEGILDIHVPQHLVCPLGILCLSRNLQSQPRRNRLAILGT
jgi:hypothetical protein